MSHTLLLDIAASSEVSLHTVGTWTFTTFFFFLYLQGALRKLQAVKKMNSNFRGDQKYFVCQPT